MSVIQLQVNHTTVQYISWKWQIFQVKNKRLRIFLLKKGSNKWNYNKFIILVSMGILMYNEEKINKLHLFLSSNLHLRFSNNAFLVMVR